jgi:sugar O-acyltransferase (sialic acid O-acetyltransferase NeuD family)
MTKLYGVYGASGCGRGIMPLLRAQFAGENAQLVFIDDAPPAEQMQGHPVWPWERFCSAPAASRHAALAVANSAVRAMLDARCAEAGVGVIGVRASNAVVMDEVEIGPGALLSPFVTLTSNIRIGRCFHGNLYSYVEHDCVIGDYVTFAPGVHCNGNVVIEDHAYIGSGAMLRQGAPGQPLRIGQGAIVGMGAVVTRDVPAGEVVAGNPARPLKPSPPTLKD